MAVFFCLLDRQKTTTLKGGDFVDFQQIQQTFIDFLVEDIPLPVVLSSKQNLHPCQKVNHQVHNPYKQKDAEYLH
jgi:hypothetical protein